LGLGSENSDKISDESQQSRCVDSFSATDGQSILLLSTNGTTDGVEPQTRVGFSAETKVLLKK
jgi:hypothetical protein